MVGNIKCFSSRYLQDCSLSNKIFKLIFPGIVLLSIMASDVVTAENVSKEIGKIQSFSGDVWIDHEGQLLDLNTVGRNSLKKKDSIQFIQSGDSVITGKHARARILLEDKTSLDLNEQTTIKFNLRKIGDNEVIRIFEFKEGQVQANLDKTELIPTEIDIKDQKVVLNKPAQINIWANNKGISLKIIHGVPKLLFSKTGHVFDLLEGHDVRIPKTQDKFFVTVTGKLPFTITSKDGSVLQITHGGEGVVRLDGLQGIKVDLVKQEAILIQPDGKERSVKSINLDLPILNATTTTTIPRSTTTSTSSTTTTTIPKSTTTSTSSTTTTIPSATTTSTTSTTTTTLPMQTTTTSSTTISLTTSTLTLPTITTTIPTTTITVTTTTTTLPTITTTVPTTTTTVTTTTTTLPRITTTTTTEREGGRGTTTTTTLPRITTTTTTKREETTTTTTSTTTTTLAPTTTTTSTTTTTLAPTTTTTSTTTTTTTTTLRPAS